MRFFDEPPGLGDAVHHALSLMGITPEGVEAWVGAPCGCDERRVKLNQLGFWAARVLAGKRDRAKEFLARMMG